jgi:long-chain acyl-CoA synthetase
MNLTLLAPQTLTRSFLETCERHGDKKAVSIKNNNTWVSYSYREYSAKVKSLAISLMGLGIQSGDRVAILSENRPEWVITDQAILMIGAVTVPIYPTLTPDQTEYILENCGAKAIVTSTQAQSEKIYTIQSKLSNLSHIIPMYPTAGVTWADLANRPEDDTALAGLYQRLESVRPENLASIVYTSGTTGLPKGAMLTHRNFFTNALEAAHILGVTEDDSCLSFLPLSHVFERTANYLAVMMGVHVNFASSMDAIAAELGEVKPTYMVSVPRLFEKMRLGILDKVSKGSPLKKQVFNLALDIGRDYFKKHGQVDFFSAFKHTVAERLVFQEIKNRTGGNLKFFFSGGAPLAYEVGEFFFSLGLPVFEAYGLTETSPGIASNRLNAYKLGTVGKPFKDVECKLAPDGELCVKGPNIMLGYWNNPQATAEAIDTDGYFHTGDIAEIDSEGFIKIVDRKKEIIVLSNGKNVAPQPLENALKASPYIEQVMVVGDNRNYMTALVVPNFAKLEDVYREKGIRDLHHPEIQAIYNREVENISKNFAKFEQIKKFALLPREFSLEDNEITLTLKLKRKNILASFKDDVEKMYG